jgi:hypothetical protein
MPWIVSDIDVVPVFLLHFIKKGLHLPEISTGLFRGTKGGCT